MRQALSAAAEDDDAGPIQNNSAAITFGFQDYYRTTLLAEETVSADCLSVVQLALSPSGCMYTLIVPLEPNRVPNRAHSQFQETCYGEPHHRYHHAGSGIPP